MPTVYLISLWPLFLTFWHHGQCTTRACKYSRPTYICSDFGVNSSSHFSFRAWKDRDKQTDNHIHNWSWSFYLVLATTGMGINDKENIAYYNVPIESLNWFEKSIRLSKVIWKQAELPPIMMANEFTASTHPQVCYVHSTVLHSHYISQRSGAHLLKISHSLSESGPKL